MAPGMVEHVLGFPNLNPRWSEDPTLTRGKLFSKAISFFHRECDVPGCHMLEPDVGRRLAGALQPREPRRRHASPRRRPLRRDEHALLPARQQDGARRQPAAEVRHRQARHCARCRTTTSSTRATSRRRCCSPPAPKNQVFTDSNIVCHERLSGLGATNTELKVYPGYGHQDVFMGKDVARDCFPAMLDFIRRHSEPAAGGRQWAARSRDGRLAGGPQADQDRDDHQRPRRAGVGADDRLRVVPGLESVRAGGVRAARAGRAAEDPPGARSRAEADLQAARHRRRARPRAAVAGDPRAAGRVRRRSRVPDRAP